MSDDTRNDRQAIPDQLCADVLSTALEGGIGYWAGASKIQRTEGDNWQYVSAELHDTEAEGDDEPAFGTAVVDYAKIRTGIDRILRGEVQVNADIRGAIESDVRDPEGGNIDADAADCIVQAGLFNAILFG